MSLRNRARALSAKAGISYEKAVQMLREVGAETKRVKVEMQWSTHRADAYAIDPNLDEEYASVRDRYVSEENCENCGQGYIRGFDKKGMSTGGSDHFCPECLEVHGSWCCPKCGDEILGDGEGEGVCNACWDYVMSKD